MAEILDTDLSNLEVDYFGLNHYGWFTKVQCNGEDATEKLKKHVAEYGYVSKASYEDALVKDPDWLHTFTNAKEDRQLFSRLSAKYILAVLSSWR